MRQATGIEAERSASASHPKWQVQNRVGGGGLYGVTDNSAATTAGGGASRAVRTGSHGEASGGGTVISRTSTGDALSPIRPPLDRGGSNDSISASSSHGSLIGAAATAGGGAGPPASPATAAAHGGRGKMEGVDIVYLKNVLLKFMEASVTGKVRAAVRPEVFKNKRGKC